MGSAIFGAPLEVEEGETLALTTSAQYLAVKPAWKEVKMYCSSQWRIAHSPKLLHVLYYAAAAGTYTPYVTEATDRLTTTHVPLDGMLTTDYLYLGTTDPVLGYYFNMGSNVNAVDTTLDFEYCSTAVAQGATIAFTDVASDSDGTDSTGTLAVDGAFTFTLPAVQYSTLGTSSVPLYGKVFWTRFKPALALSATVDVLQIIPIYKNTNYGYREAGLEYTWTINEARTGGYVLLATAGTPTLDITWIKHT